MTDQQALTQYASSRDAEGFRILVEQYQGLVYSAARRRLAHIPDIEYVVQITFYRLARAAGTIKRDLPAWLYSTAVNAANELIRRDATRRRHEAALAADLPASYADDQAEWAKLSMLIDEAMLELNAEEQTLLVEHFFRGRSQRDIAGEMQISQPTVMRRINAAVEALRQRLAGHGYTAAAPLLFSSLGQLPQPAIPAATTAQLTKIGLSGATGAPAAATVALTAPLLIKVAAAIAGIGALVAAVTVMAPSGPAIPEAASAPSQISIPATAPAHPANWRATLEAAYALAPGQNLKFIPPGRLPPERKRYFSEVEKEDSPMPCIQWRWVNGTLKRQWMHSGAGAAGTALSAILLLCANLDEHQAPTAGLPPINANGDWVLRDGATTEAILADLHTILLNEFNTDIRFEKSEVNKPVLVVSGRYGFVRLPDATQDDIQLYSDVMDHPKPGDSIMGGGTGTPAEMWKLLGQWLGTPVVDEAQAEPAKVSWLLSRSLREAAKDPAKRQQVLDNLTVQTGLTFNLEERPFVTWKLTSAAATPTTHPATAPVVP